MKFSDFIPKETHNETTSNIIHLVNFSLRFYVNRKLSVLSICLNSVTSRHTSNRPNELSLIFLYIVNCRIRKELAWTLNVTFSYVKLCSLIFWCCFLSMLFHDALLERNIQNNFNLFLEKNCTVIKVMIYFLYKNVMFLLYYM